METVTAAGSTTDTEQEAVLKVEGLRIVLDPSGVDIDDEVTLVIHRGEVLGLVGESASGKTTVGTSLLDYQRRGAKIAEGQVEIDGQDILAMDPEALRGVRGGADQLRAPGLLGVAQPGAAHRYAAHGDPRGARLRLVGGRSAKRASPR